MSHQVFDLFLKATLATLEMVFASAAIAVIFGLPLALLLTVTAPNGLWPSPVIRKGLGFIIDLTRAVPFIILLVLLIPFTRLLVGTALGTGAAIVPLSVTAIPYFARIAEVSLKDVDPALIEAIRSMGATRLKVIWSVLLPEALPGLISGLTVTVVTLISASAMAGVVGAGGLGDLAIRYGYQRFNTGMMLWIVGILVLITIIVQVSGNLVAARLRKNL
ncbi:ABC transporter permease [Acetobacter persici]|uniref:methionine ABC transporter permease n=1 Tax=Acetobacter persici TaxID=1076596 RepID=UPI001BA4BDD6|nr:methionine ABC transporter permease [Acetobacter persici]MBS0962741.1 ABC transporter permease [Acetobacter persici]MBS1001307.1 ABC transporter permease [Acetobacter persici]MBS1014397.1 ABC transporter permease [Acetobacter persici]